MRNRTVLAICGAILAAAPLSKAFANHTTIQFGGIETAGLKAICRPAPQFGNGYQLCLARERDEIRPRSQLAWGFGWRAVPFYLVPLKATVPAHRQPDVRLATAGTGILTPTM